MEMIFEGCCWNFGDNVACDGDMVPLELVFRRETRGEILRGSLFTGIDPEFPSRMRQGDLVVAGTRFGSGHAHPQAAYALAAAGVGVVAASVPRGHYRNLVNAAVPFLPEAAEAVAACETGDRLRVDFVRGIISNLTRNVTVSVEPLAPMLLETIALGGWKPMVQRRLQSMRAAATRV